MFGALLALASAASFALTNAFFRRGAFTGSVVLAMVITVPLGALVFLAVAAAAGLLPLLGEFSGVSLVLFALAGVLHFVCGRYCNFRAIKAAGAVVAGPLVDSGILWTVLAAVFLLGETLTPLSMAGIALIMIGPSLSLRGRRLPQRTEGGFEPRYREGVTFALLASLCFGMSPILVGFALPAASGIGTGIAGGLVSYGAAALLVLPVLLIGTSRTAISAAGRAETGWFTLSGVMISLSQMARYMALAVAPVSLVMPLLRTAIVFRLLFAWLLNRKAEVLTRDAIATTVVCGAGVMLMALGL